MRLSYLLSVLYDKESTFDLAFSPSPGQNLTRENVMSLSTQPISQDTPGLSLPYRTDASPTRGGFNFLEFDTQVAWL